MEYLEYAKLLTKFDIPYSYRNSNIYITEQRTFKYLYVCVVFLASDILLKC